MIYSIEKNSLQRITEKNVLEKEVQKLIGENLNLVLQLEFVELEFTVEKKRIDILAFDEEKNAPVIIELKRENSVGLFDQGMEYFNLLSDRKSDFLLKLHEKLKIPADVKKINWENSRVIFIGKNFTQRQQRAIDFQGLPIEIWEYEWFKNNLFYLEQIGLKKSAKLEIGLQENNKNNIQKLKREFKEYTKDTHRERASGQSFELFEQIEEELLKWDNVSEKFNKLYVVFNINGSSFCSIVLLKSKLYLYFGSKKRKILSSSVLKIKDVSKLGKWGNGDYEIQINTNADLLEIFSLLKQSYTSFSL